MPMLPWCCQQIIHHNTLGSAFVVRNSISISHSKVNIAGENWITRAGVGGKTGAKITHRHKKRFDTALDRAEARTHYCLTRHRQFHSNVRNVFGISCAVLLFCFFFNQWLNPLDTNAFRCRDVQKVAFFWGSFPPPMLAGTRVFACTNTLCASLEQTDGEQIWQIESSLRSVCFNTISGCVFFVGVCVCARTLRTCGPFLSHSTFDIWYICFLPSM